MTETLNTDPNILNRAHPWIALLFVSLVPLVLGALLAPVVLRFLLWLGTHVDLGRHFSNPPLRRVVSRTVMVLAFALLVPAVKLAGIRSAADVGWPRDPQRRQRLGLWFAVGILSIGAAYLLSAAAGALYFRPRSTDLWVVTSKWTGLLAGAWIVGCIEETLFRGFIFSTLRKRSSPALSTLLASLFFSGVHFLRPVEPPHLNPTD